MIIKIYVVLTELKTKNPLKALRNKSALNQLKTIKAQIISAYNGLTESENKKGYWVFENKLYVDSVNTWEILTESLTELQKAQIEKTLFEIKRLTKQKSQLYTIDNKPIFL